MSDEKPTALYDEKGYPLWMRLPMEFWVNKDVLDFIKKAAEEDGT